MRDRDVLFLALMTHYFVACLDNALMGIMIIWGTFAIADESALSLQEGGPAFVNAAFVNLMLAYSYVLFHVCACPIFMCCAMYKPGVRALFQHQQDWHADVPQGREDTAELQA